MSTLAKRLTEPSSAMLLLGIGFFVYAVGWAFLADSINSSFVSPTKLGEASRDQHKALKLYRLMFGYPWISLSAGMICGSLYGIWAKQHILRGINDRIFRQWLIAQGRRREALQGSGRYSAIVILVIAAILAILYVLGLSLKPFLHASVGLSMAWIHPAQRQVYAGTISRLHSSEFDDTTRVAVIRWEKRQRQAAFIALGVGASLIAIGAYLFVSGTLEIRGDFAEIKQSSRVN